MTTDERFSRTERLFGKEAMARLARAHVAVFGLGGVGSYAAEALARSGIGCLELIDCDTVSVSNINRQLLADDTTVGRYKTDVCAARIRTINPAAVVVCHRMFYTLENAGRFDFSACDYIIDAIDTVTGKISLAVNAQHAGTPILSVMGTGNKTDPTALEVADLAETSVCPLARVMRRELRKRGILHLKVVYSKEEPRVPFDEATKPDAQNLETGAPLRRSVPASCAFVPPVAGFIAAGEAVKELLRQDA